MTRVRSLEGSDAGIVASIIQFLLRLNVGKNLNPTKVQAHATRPMVANFLTNAIMGTGSPTVGKDMVELVKIRAATRNGCPF